MVQAAKAQRARRRAAEARLARAVARQRAADPARQVRQAEVANQVRRLRRALEARRAALELVAGADRRAAEATARLVELGEPVSRIAGRVGVPAASLRKTLRAHLMKASATEGGVGPAVEAQSDSLAAVHDDV